MNVPGVASLIGDIKFAFGLPIVAYVMFQFNLELGRAANLTQPLIKL